MTISQLFACRSPPKQDLYINAALAQLGCSLLWNLLREGMTAYRGFFLNIADFRTQPLAV